jgi:hypothetical protein
VAGRQVANALLEISLFGNPQNQESQVGQVLGDKDVQDGISNAPQ